jgi:TusA-related sulfurtransferase
MVRKGRYQLNLRGLVSPFLYLRVIQRFHELEPGDILSLEHIDPESVDDLMAILKHYPLELGALQEKDGSYTLQVTKNTPTSL